MENRTVTITISSSDRKAELSFNEDGNIYDYLEEISRLLITWGFHPDSVKDGICALAENYEEETKEDKEEGE
jgi:hypothetical protein